ncbi:MAG: DUF1501 domain-containing protein [Bryobacteraceae bacterium]
MDWKREMQLLETRRQFFGRGAKGLSVAALASLMEGDASAAPTGGQPGLPHFAATAKRVIWLHQSGGPSQLDLFDYKPQLKKYHGSELPGSIRMGQRITGMTSGQSSFPCASSIFKFEQAGKAGMWMSELIPHHKKIADDICLVKSVHTDAINHDPAITFIQSGSQQPGRPSIGAWVSYGLGSETQELPSFVVLLSQQNSVNADQPLFSRLWGAGFLPSRYQGVRLRSGKDPVLYLADPAGIEREGRREMLDALQALNKMREEAYHDPEIDTRIQQYEMAYKMQASVPELTDLAKEPASTFALYGEDARKPGTYAANCLLARRLVERGVRFVQLYHKGWDQHGNLPRDLALQCKASDQGAAALVQDLKQRGMLNDTLVVWGGEFGRTVYCQGKLTDVDYGRDHHPRNFTMWMAGGGVKRGFQMGETDDYSYNIVRDPVHIHDIQATLLHCLGVDHTRLTYKFQGRWFRLTDVHGNVVKPLLA